MFNMRTPFALVQSQERETSITDRVVSASTRPWPAPVEPESARLGAQLARCMVIDVKL